MFARLEAEVSTALAAMKDMFVTLKSTGLSQVQVDTEQISSRRASETQHAHLSAQGLAPSSSNDN
jgi:hypothetical protein